MPYSERELDDAIASVLGWKQPRSELGSRVVLARDAAAHAFVRRIDTPAADLLREALTDLNTGPSYVFNFTARYTPEEILRRQALV